MKKVKKQGRFKKRVMVSLFSFSLLLVCVLLYIFCVINPVVTEATEAMIFSLSTSAVSDAVYDVMQEENLTYADLVNIEYDGNGDINLISVDTVLVNSIARKFYQVAQVYLDRMGEEGIDINIGTFTGLPFLVGVGPTVNIKLVSIGAMTSSFHSSFKSAGVNQTNHSLYIKLFASVSLVLPTYSTSIDSVTEFLVAESVIVGKVPEFYLGTSSSINLIPSTDL